MPDAARADRVASAARSMRLRALVLMLLLAGSVVLAVTKTVAWPHSLLASAVLLLPLALPLPGIVRAHRRTFAWATLCITPYFIYGLTELVANPEVRPIALGMLVASLGVVAALIAYLRLTRPVAVDQES